LAEFSITSQIDTNVADYFKQFAGGLDSVMDFAMQQARLFLKNEGIPEAIAIIADSAAGFPKAYRNHLITRIHAIPIETVHLGEGIVEISFSLTPLGGWNELMSGAHHNAMLAENEGEEFRSFRITTKSQIQKVQLPYEGQELLNDPERRLEWWNTAIIERRFFTNVGKNWNWTKKALQTEENAWEAEGVPTYEQVASARVNEAWEPFGVAPEWVLLEDGTPSGAGNPHIAPQDLLFRLQQLTDCACREAVQQGVLAFEKLLEERQVVGVKGPQASPYNTLGQFVNYKDLLEASVPNLSNCLALL
jgi:hypothetical protein